MSTDNDDSDDEVVTSPRVNTSLPVQQVNAGATRTHSRGITRTDLSSEDLRSDLWTQTYDNERSLYEALGYVKKPKYEHFLARYKSTDVAPALVDKVPQKAWDQPEIIDTGREGERTEFEKQVNAFLSGEWTTEDPISVMERATRMERLGEYSLIFIGFADDNAATDDGDETLENPVDDSTLSPPEGEDDDPPIQYITPYDQQRIDDDEAGFDLIEDPLHSRYGKPKEYEVDLGHDEDTTIHWTRVIHVVGDKFDRQNRSMSVLRQSLNRIDDIEKILGGAAEAFWRGSYSGLVISPPTVNGQIQEFTDSGEELHSQIKRYIHNKNREIFTEADIDTIDVTIESPLDHLDAAVRSLAMNHEIPQSILMGNETGERATAEDRQMFHETAADFRVDYCEPVVLRRLIDRLINFGAFPSPEGRYEFRWPELAEKTDSEKADIMQTKANAISAGTGGDPFRVVSPQEFRQEVLGMSPERGSEVDDVDLDMQAASPEDLEVDEDDERVQKQFDRLNSVNVEEIDAILEKKVPDEDESEKLKVSTPDGNGVIVDILTSGFEEEGVSVEASEDEPKLVVVLGDGDDPWGFYTPDEVDQEDWDSGVDDPRSDLSEEDESRENLMFRLEQALAAFRGRQHQEGHFTWPESWRESDKPARLIALDAWISMRGSVSGCMREMRGEVADPGRFCADFADRLYQWDYWRGDSWAPGE